MSEFLLPSLGADMDKATVVEWLVKPGDAVGRGDIVALVETEKGVIEVEIWEAATIGELLVEPGAEVPVGAAIATLLAGAEAQPAESEPAEVAASDAGAESEPMAAAAVGLQAPAEHHEAHGVTPPVRHLAHTLHVDLDDVEATGPDGSVTRTDIQRHHHQQQPAAAVPLVDAGEGRRLRVSPYARKRALELGMDIGQIDPDRLDEPITSRTLDAIAEGQLRPPEATVASAAGDMPEPATTLEDAKHDTKHEAKHGAKHEAKEKAAAQAAAMRHAIAQVMAKSKREIPHYYLAATVDLEASMTWLQHTNAERPVADRILPAVLLLKASALAIGEVPEMNGFFIDGQYQPGEHVHLGVAISLRKGGLIAPAIHDADNMTLDELMAALRDLVARTRTGRLRGSEMSDPTITITNLGDRGVEAVFPVIYAPQVAIVGFGKVTDAVVAEDGMIGIHPTVQATLAADHRVSDGHRGGRYLAAVNKLLQKPEEL